jgi:ABC-2 type transport system permease protein
LMGIERWALHPPASIFSFWCFLLSLLAAVVLASTFSMMMTISLLWTISADGVSNLFPALILSLCGIIVPIPFFPDWMQPILRVLPFRGIMDVPFQIYIGTIPPHAAIWEVGRQWLWIGGLILFSRYLFDKGVKRVVVQGG